MNNQEVINIFEDESIEQDLPFSAFLGLSILRKYVPDADIEAASHDKIYSIGVYRTCEAGLTMEDAINLKRMNWMIDLDCFACFV